jgi:hypothetical protein
MIAVSAESGYEFAEAKAFLSAAKSAPTAGAASGAAKADAPKVEEKEEEKEDANVGNLFGGGDEYDGY